MNLKNSILFVFTILLFAACDEKRVYDEYRSTNGVWDKKQVMGFKLPKVDTLKKYDLFVNLRGNNDYPYNNIFLIVKMEEPGGNVNVDTLEYQMAAPDGSLLGEGFSDVKESKLVYKDRYRFKFDENNKIFIKQAVRQYGKVVGVEKLPGITEVGFRMESSN